MRGILKVPPKDQLEPYWAKIASHSGYWYDGLLSLNGREVFIDREATANNLGLSNQEIGWVSIKVAGHPNKNCNVAWIVTSGYCLKCRNKMRKI